MLSSMKNMFKVPDLRNKILFTLFMILLYRLGSHIPVPGIDVDALKALQKQAATVRASSVVVLPDSPPPPSKMRIEYDAQPTLVLGAGDIKL